MTYSKDNFEASGLGASTNRHKNIKSIVYSQKLEYNPCSNCTLPTELDEEEHCFFCKRASPAEFKDRKKPTSTTCI